MMDAYKGGMYIKNRVDERTRSMLCNGPHYGPLPAKVGWMKEQGLCFVMNHSLPTQI